MPSRLYATLIRAAKISILSLSSKLLASFLQNFAKKELLSLERLLQMRLFPKFYILTLSFQDRRPASGQPLFIFIGSFPHQDSRIWFQICHQAEHCPASLHGGRRLPSPFGQQVADCLTAEGGIYRGTRKEEIANDGNHQNLSLHVAYAAISHCQISF